MYANRELRGYRRPSAGEWLAVKHLSDARVLGLNSFPLCIHTLCKYASDMSASTLGTFIVVRAFIAFY